MVRQYDAGRSPAETFSFSKILWLKACWLGFIHFEESVFLTAPVYAQSMLDLLQQHATGVHVVERHGRKCIT